MTSFNRGHFCGYLVGKGYFDGLPPGLLSAWVRHCEGEDGLNLNKAPWTNAEMLNPRRAGAASTGPSERHLRHAHMPK